MRLVVLGAPGAGKGTQAIILSKHYGTQHISTGDILRTEMKRGTEIGKSVESLMGDGRLVPDEIVIEIVKEYVHHDSFILDGFPRNLYQAEALKALCEEYNTPLDKCICVDVADEIILERMSGRIVCHECGKMYHIHHNPPKVEGICECGGELIQREDDKYETVKKRLEVYHEITEPIIQFYQNEGILLRFDGTKEITEITRDITTALEG